MKKSVFSVLIIITVILTVLLQTACVTGSNETQNYDRQITDMKGNIVNLPPEINSYVVLWKGFTGFVAMLDNGEGLKGCDYDINNRFDKWFFQICPNAEKAANITEEVTLEEILSLDVDVVFWQSDEHSELVSQLAELGVPSVNIYADDYETLKSALIIAANTLGTDFALERAELYIEFFEKAVIDVSQIADTIPDNERMSVLSFRSVEQLRADGINSFADQWINTIGAYNVITDKGKNQYFDIEQLYNYNPDVIVSSMVGDDNILYSDNIYAPISAVKNKRVYISPYGILRWNRITVEIPLQLYWASSVVYPNYFDNDIDDLAVYFYKTFFNYDITSDELNGILTCDPTVK